MRVVVITGASRGFGYELALKCVRAGDRVFSLSRSGGAPEGAEGIVCDVSEEESVRAAFQEVLRRAGKIDVLVNNAGFGISGSAEYSDPADIRRIAETNFLGAVSAARHALPALRASRGVLLNVSSVAAVMPIPFQSFYSATKAALLSFSDCLRNEVRPYGVRVCCVMPGDARSGFTGHRVKNAEEGVYAERVLRSVSRMEHDEENGMSASSVAAAMFRLMRKKRLPSRRVVGARYRLLCAVARFVPQGLLLRILYGMYAR